MPSRLAMYGLGSTVLFGAVVSSTLKARPNFYSAAVALGMSSGASLVLANFALFNAIWIGLVLKKLFFGQLRSVEYEHLFERLWVFLTESLLALTIFKDEFSPGFVFMYGVLLFLKCFHWITSDRVDYMDQVPPPGPPVLFHVRVASILGLLAAADIILVSYSLDSILYEGVSAMVLFSSEFMILLAGAGGIAARYAVNLWDLRRARGREDAPVWEDKSVWMFYIDLAVDFVKLLTYLCFFIVILMRYGLPLHILRDVYMTLRSFLSRVSDLIRYRQATRDMDSLYPDATEEDVSRDRICIICREEMVARGSAPAAPEEQGDPSGPAPAVPAAGPNETPKKLSCGHVFHFHCLRSWLERQQSCPTCRRDVLRSTAPSLQRQNAPQPPPPRPAPGAAPAPPDAAARPPAATTPLQAIYDQYFPPARPTEPPAPAAAATGVPSGSSADPIPTATAAAAAGSSGSATLPLSVLDHSTGPSAGSFTQADQAIQRGIWGGPVVPGRFHAAPLGAAPRLHPGSYAPAGYAPAARRYGDNSPSTAVATDRRQSPDANTARLPIPSITTAPPEAGSSTSRLPVSGTTTPFSSQAPTVFPSPGSSRPQANSLGEPSVSSDEADTDARARRERAEAAMKRMTDLAGRGKPAAPEHGLTIPAEGGSSLEIPITDGISSAKGKEKEEYPLPYSVAQEDHLDAPSRSIPYLSSPGPSDLRQPTDWSRVPQSVQEADAALEERLRVLREVDQSVWALVSELTRMRQGWTGASQLEEGGVAGDDTPPAGQSASVSPSIHDEL